MVFQANHIVQKINHKTRCEQGQFHRGGENCSEFNGTRLLRYQSCLIVIMKMASYN